MVAWIIPNDNSQREIVVIGHNRIMYQWRTDAKNINHFRWCSPSPNNPVWYDWMDHKELLCASISYPLFTDADTVIYPHTPSQYHARPKAKPVIAILSVDKFPYTQKQNWVTNSSHDQTIFVTL